MDGNGIRQHLSSSVLIFATCCATLPGCHRGPAYDTAALAGRVMIDGEPVRDGGVQFMPLEHGHPAFSEVRDGVYAAWVPKGRVRVLFSATRETGRTVEMYSTKTPEVLDVLPASLRDGIEITVIADDPARDFSLSSKRKAAP